MNTLAAQIAEESQQFADPNPQHVHLLFSAHSVPVSVIAGGDPYQEQIEATVESIALEVERISENQRYLTKLQSERPPLSSGTPPDRQR